MVKFNEIIMVKLFNIFREVNEYRSEIMGVATLWVLSLHFFSELYTDVRIPVFTEICSRGNIGVDVFLLLSGISLYYSWTNNPSIVCFYKKRFNRVVIPWLVLALPYWLFMYFNGEVQSLFMLIGNFFGVTFWTHGIITTWYIQLIIMLYIIYPFIVKEQIKSNKRVICLMGMVILINCLGALIIPSWYKSADLFLARIPVFFLGSLLGQVIKDEKNNDSPKIYILYFVMLSFIFALSIFISIYNHELGVLFYYLGAAGVSFFIIIILIVIMKRLRLINYFLRNIGYASLEVYLLNVFARNIIVVNKIGFEFSYYKKIIFLIFVSGIILAMGMFCNRIIKLVNVTR